MSARTWTPRILGDKAIADISSGGTPSRSRPEYFGGTIKWAKSGDLNDGSLTETAETISRAGLDNSAAKLLPPNTVLLAMYGATAGKTALLKTQAASNQAVCAIQPNSEVLNPQFLQFMLMHIRPQLLRERYGGAQPNISQTIIRNLELPCPERSEQEKIAAVLRKVQSAIGTEEKLLAIARDLKQSTLYQLFTVGLRGESPQETDIGLVPNGWEVVSLDSMCSFASGGTPSKSQPEFWKGNFPWASPKDMKRSRLSDTKDHISKAGLEAGSTLVPANSLFVVVRGMILAKDVPVALTEVPMAFNQDLKAILPGDKLVAEFLLYAFEAFRHQLFQKVGRSAHGTRTLLSHELSSFLVPVPSQEEQREIAKILFVLDQKISLHERKRETLQELFQTLLHELMTGQIRVDKLDIDVSEVQVEKDGARVG